MVSYSCVETRRKALMTGWYASQQLSTDRLAGIAQKGGDARFMTAFEIAQIVLGVIGLLISLGMLLVALLNYLDKRERQHKK